jgi:hypothetical protein
MKSKHRGPSKFRKTEATRLARAALDADVGPIIKTVVRVCLSGVPIAAAAGG